MGGPGAQEEGEALRHWLAQEKKWGLTGKAFMQHKYGADVDVNRAANLAKRSRAHS